MTYIIHGETGKMNTTALAIIQPDELETIQRTGRLLAASGYFDAKGESAQAIAMMAAKIIAGREMGFGPFAAVNGIHIIKGKPSVGANLQAAAVKGSGRYDYRVRELTNEKCRIEFFERVDGKWDSLGVSEFTKEDANKAGTQNMDKFPKNMLFARAMSNGVRFYVPDVFNGNVVYVPEELGAEVDAEGNVIDVTPRFVDDVDNPFDNSTPYFVHAWRNLTGQHYDLVRDMAELHDQSDGPCTSKQYQYLTGIVDALTNKQHNYALSVLCQSEISGDNMPGRRAAGTLLKFLPETIVQKDADGKPVKDTEGKSVMVPNPDFNQAMVDIIIDIATANQPQPA